MFGEQVPERLGCSGGAAGAGGEGDGDPLAVRRGSLSGASVQRRLVDDGAGGRHAAVRRERPPPLLSGEMVLEKGLGSKHRKSPDLSSSSFVLCSATQWPELHLTH